MQRLKKNRNMIKPAAMRTPGVLMPRLGTKSGSIRWSRERESVEGARQQGERRLQPGVAIPEPHVARGEVFRSPSAR